METMLFFVLITWTFVSFFLLLRQNQRHAGFIRLEEQLKQKDFSLTESKLALEKLEAQKEAWQTENTRLSSEIAALNTKLLEQEKILHEKSRIFADAEKKLTDAFKALSAEALQASNTSFLELAKENLGKHQQEAKSDLEQRQNAIQTLITPLVESLKQVDTKIQDIEKQRIDAYSTLKQQVSFLKESQDKLSQETGNLANALKAPQVRGRWGEMTLLRVAEIAGMVEYCDFAQQESKTTEDGRLRPDMIVKLPGGKNIVVDAKVPLLAYTQAFEATNDEDRQHFLEQHTRQLQTHMRQLGQKNYWEQFQPTPELVVMFIPGESFFSAAINQNKNLIEEGALQKVILATPTTLIALLKSVAYGWQQEQLAQNAEEISRLGKDLYERITTLSGYFADLGQALRKSTTAYNQAVGALELRVLPQARKFEALGVKSKTNIVKLPTIDSPVRDLQAPELVLGEKSTSSVVEPH